MVNICNRLDRKVYLMDYWRPK